jgi:hypothetical protein
MRSYREFSFEQVAKTFSYDGRDGKLYRKLKTGRVKLVKTIQEDISGNVRAARVMFNGHTITVTYVMWMLKTGGWPLESMIIDHADNNIWDMRWDNLREATQKQVGWKRRSWGQSGVKGVYRTSKGRWRVRILENGIRKHYGTYATLEEAKAVANREIARIQGEFAYGAPRFRRRI